MRFVADRLSPLPSSPAVTTYTPSKLLAGEAATLRQHTLTRWMSRDLTQAAVDFCRNLGLIPAYNEYSAGHLTRYLFWCPPAGALLEVRSGRTLDKFEEIDRRKLDKAWRLLSLHISEDNLYSAVWISSAHFDIAKAFLAAHGITTAERHNA
jgi:hypothetical protein